MSSSKKKNSSCSISLKDIYNLACEKHEIEESKFQIGLIREFEIVSNNLLSRKRNSFLFLLKNFLPMSISRRTAKVQKGIYIWGSVGVGKTFMMDLFYDFLPIEGKERYHFHEFMIMVHKILKKNMNQQNPLRQVTSVVLKNTNILFLDEFHVTDITDAMILGRLLDYLFKAGIVLITTSNSRPDELYKDGLQRERFLIAISILKRQTTVIQLFGLKDYRLQAFKREGVTEKSRLSGKSLRNLFNRLTSLKKAADNKVWLNDRYVKLQGASQGVAWFTFRQLCQDNRSVSEYIDLASRFHTVLIEDIPSMDDNDNDATRRFINLVDELYEKNVNLIISSDFTAAEYYVGKKLSEMFLRTESRLMEMLTPSYISRPHRSSSNE